MNKWCPIGNETFFVFLRITKLKLDAMPAILEKKKTKTHSVEEERNELAIKLLSVKDKYIVHTINLIFDDLTSVKRTTKTQYNKEIDAAVKRVRGGKSVSNDEVMKEMEKW